jgi:hypothetical protein
MAEITEADVKAILGDTEEIILREMLRTKASLAELRRAIDYVQNLSASDLISRGKLPRRVQRLVDLLLVGLQRPAAVVQAPWHPLPPNIPNAQTRAV